MRPHVAFFSQTGTEIVNISKKRNKWPDKIVTNFRPENKRQVHLELKGKYVVLPSEPTVEDYEKVLSKFENPVVTLHGWLRIIPEEICNKYEIYNGHPGDIIAYPELKGKDPQKRAYELDLPYSGAVLHRVVPEVDSGEVVGSDSVYIKELSLIEIFHTLHEISTSLWVKYLPELLNEQENKWF